ncbi:hypothetical protein B7463_g2302, partial [Scytalidium lignicola]
MSTARSMSTKEVGTETLSFRQKEDDWLWYSAEAASEKQARQGNSTDVKRQGWHVWLIGGAFYLVYQQ